MATALFKLGKMVKIMASKPVLVATVATAATAYGASQWDDARKALGVNNLSTRA